MLGGTRFLEKAAFFGVRHVDGGYIYYGRGKEGYRAKMVDWDYGCTVFYISACFPVWCVTYLYVLFGALYNTIVVDGRVMCILEYNV